MIGNHFASLRHRVSFLMGGCFDSLRSPAPVQVRLFGHGHTSAPLWFYRSPLLHRNPVKWGSRLRIGATCQDYCRGLLFQANPAPLPAPEQHLTSTPPIPHLRGCAGWALFIACPVIGFGLYGVMPHGSAYGETPLLAGQQRPISRQLMIPRETDTRKRPRLLPMGCGSGSGDL